MMTTLRSFEVASKKKIKMYCAQQLFELFQFDCRCSTFAYLTTLKLGNIFALDRDNAFFGTLIHFHWVKFLNDNAGVIRIYAVSYNGSKQKQFRELTFFGVKDQSDRDL